MKQQAEAQRLHLVLPREIAVRFLVLGSLSEVEGWTEAPPPTRFAGHLPRKRWRIFLPHLPDSILPCEAGEVAGGEAG